MDIERIGTQLPTTHPIYKDACSLVNQLWQLPRKTTYLPVPNPVSILREDMSKLMQSQYYASAKLDGTRYLLLLGMHETTGENYAVFIDRAYHMYHVKVMIPESYYQGTLIDGEMVICNEGTIHYVSFDIISREGMDCTQCSYNVRLENLQSCMCIIRLESEEPCAFSCKRCLPMVQLRHLCNEMRDSPLPSDGLIFMPNNVPVQTGMHRSMFKWKESHTLDFLLKHEGTVDSACLHCSGIDGTIDSRVLGLQLEHSDMLKEAMANDSCIVECKCTLLTTPLPNSFHEQVPIIGTCRIINTRPDKPSPNFERTIRVTINNIKEGISMEDLHSYFNNPMMSS